MNMNSNSNNKREVLSDDERTGDRDYPQGV